MRSLMLFAAVAAMVTARVFDSVPSIPKGWGLASPGLPSDKLTLKIGLKQAYPYDLEQAVLAMSSPSDPNCGKHLSREELRSYVAPTERATGEVMSWLAAHSIDPSVDNDWMTITTNVSTAKALLEADFHWYEFAGGSGLKMRTLSYSVPDSVAQHVDLVQPTTRFGLLSTARSNIFKMTVLDGAEAAAAGFEASSTADAAACNTSVTPACLKAQYNIGYTPNEDGNLVAFASYLEQYARYSDLALFEQQQLPAAAGQNFSVTLINGGLNDQNSSEDSGEANLDLQYILGVSAPVPILEYSTGGRGPLIPTLNNGFPSTNEPYLEFLTYVLNLTDAELPQTLTTSYGEEEQSVPVEYALKICNLFMQLGARGVSVLFSSGDSGPGGSCRSNADNTTVTFQPSFPAGCPYVTAVGATTASSPERGVGFSGGGFSNLHAQPEYQTGFVDAYSSSIGDTYAPFFNRSGRGIPDVSAQGLEFVVVDGGRTALISGTSASSPVFAGVVALLNAARRAQGQPGLGFLNPFLYHNPAAFTDILSGFTSGCRGAGGGLPSAGARWNCTAGWDPVTGLGTPLFDKLLEAAAPGTENA